MAINLLKGKEKTHSTHHTIESILWLLIFVTSEYGGIPTNPFNGWEGISMKNLGGLKNDFLQDPEYTPTYRYRQGEECVRDLISATATASLCSLLTHDVYLNILQP